MTVQTEQDWQAWREHSTGRRQGLVRRQLVLAWLRLDPRHQGLSAAEIGERCPVYAEMNGGQEARARNDLNVMQDYDCTVLSSRNRPARWSVTALGAGAE